MSTKRPWQERLWDLAQPNQDGCWIWQAATGAAGYGVFKADGFQTSAHRWAYIAAKGEIPPGLEVDHLCYVPSCINPAHLEAVTHAENQRRRTARQTHCVWGHEYTPENTRVSKCGRRRCRACDREAHWARRQMANTA